MFGREARYPTEIPEDYNVDSSVEDNMSVEEVTENVLKCDEAIQSVITSKQQKTTKSNGKATGNFHVGMKVWRLNVRSQQRKGGKLDPNYQGPYTIISISRKSVDLQDNQGGITPKINDHLRVYTEELPRVPRKSNQNLTTAPVTNTTTSSSSTETNFTPVTSGTLTAPVTTPATVQIPSYLGVTKLTVDPFIIKHKCDKLNSSRPVQY
ncbi:hypothetical protein ILYODFUR_010494 [Ilyodon furcidens]|uniref:Uncharacterized protein n=1 Tax=Ilyodon furcidens TaxID=33524 RepID=A0ABV0SLU2_9TELE